MAEIKLTEWNIVSDKDTIPYFQGIDLTGIDPYLAIRASRLFDTCSMEIFRLIALLNKCKQENPATAKLVDDFTEALTDILDAHEQDVVVNNGDKISRHLYDRAIEAEKQACELNEKIHELYGQIHELEAQLAEERENSSEEIFFVNGRGYYPNATVATQMAHKTWVSTRNY